MLKKLLILFSCFVLILSTIGCSSNNTTESQLDQNDFNFDFGTGESADSMDDSNDTESDTDFDADVETEDNSDNDSNTENNIDSTDDADVNDDSADNDDAFDDEANEDSKDEDVNSKDTSSKKTSSKNSSKNNSSKNNGSKVTASKNNGSVVNKDDSVEILDNNQDSNDNSNNTFIDDIEDSNDDSSNEIVDEEITSKDTNSKNTSSKKTSSKNSSKNNSSGKNNSKVTSSKDKNSSKVTISTNKTSSKVTSSKDKASSKTEVSENKTSSKVNSSNNKNPSSTVTSTGNVSSSNTASQNNGPLIDNIYDTSSVTSSTTSNSVSSSAACNHSYIEADCEQPEECKFCGKIKSKALGHNFVNGVCSVCDATELEWYTNDTSITKSEVEQILAMQYTKPKNVIMMIGDGMGPNDIAYTEKNFSKCYDFGLVLNQIKNTGWATTRSASSAVTDSAASGTALATGFKTSNGSIGLSVTGEKLTNISEIARENGKKIGIVTNDDIVGATPSAFGVHIDSRGLYEHIARKFTDFAPDVLIGQGFNYFTGLKLDKFVLAKDFSKFNSSLNSNIKCNRPFLGFFEQNNSSSSSSLDTLAYCSEIALNRLSKNSPNGFFLMIENTTCDDAGHNTNINNKMRGVVMLDRAVAKVLKFMKNNPDTLLIITSDHDNGNITMDGTFPNGGGHTGIDVRTFAVGYGAEYFNGTTVDNTDIAKFAIEAVKNY